MIYTFDTKIDIYCLCDTSILKPKYHIDSKEINSRWRLSDASNIYSIMETN